MCCAAPWAANRVTIARQCTSHACGLTDLYGRPGARHHPVTTRQSGCTAPPWHNAPNGPFSAQSAASCARRLCNQRRLRRGDAERAQAWRVTESVLRPRTMRCKHEFTRVLKRRQPLLRRAWRSRNAARLDVTSVARRAFSQQLTRSHWLEASTSRFEARLSRRDRRLEPVPALQAWICARTR